MSKFIRIILTVIGSIIAVQCLILMIFGKINFGTVVPFLIGVIFIIHGVYWHKVKNILKKRRWLKRVWIALWTGFGLWLASFVVFAFTLKAQINQNNGNIPPVDAIIVLGSGTVDGKPTPTLAKRLDAAVPIIKSQPNAIIITSGGIGLGRSRSEANIMATYLNQTHQIGLNQIVQEGRSSSTEENLANSKMILADNDIFVDRPNTAVAIVTSDFHTVRAAAIARQQGYTVPITVASTTPLSIRYNAWFREYFAYVSGWLFNEWQFSI